jgi:hypothetical protein
MSPKIAPEATPVPTEPKRIDLSPVITPETVGLFHRPTDPTKRRYSTAAAVIAGEAENLKRKVSDLSMDAVQNIREGAALTGTAYKSRKAEIEAIFAPILSQLDDLTETMFDAIATAERMTAAEAKAEAKPEATA